VADSETQLEMQELMSHRKRKKTDSGTEIVYKSNVGKFPIFYISLSSATVALIQLEFCEFESFFCNV